MVASSRKKADVVVYTDCQIVSYMIDSRASINLTAVHVTMYRSIYTLNLTSVLSKCTLMILHSLPLLTDRASYSDMFVGLVCDILRIIVAVSSDSGNILGRKTAEQLGLLSTLQENTTNIISVLPVYLLH